MGITALYTSIPNNYIIDCLWIFLLRLKIPAKAMLYFKPSKVLMELVGDAISQNGSPALSEAEFPLPITSTCWEGNRWLIHSFRFVTGVWAFCRILKPTSDEYRDAWTFARPWLLFWLGAITSNPRVWFQLSEQSFVTQLPSFVRAKTLPTNGWIYFVQCFLLFWFPLCLRILDPSFFKTTLKRKTLMKKYH